MACHITRSRVALIELKNILHIMIASLHRFQFGLFILFDSGEERLFVENLVHLGHNRLLTPVLSLNPDPTVVRQGLGGLFSLDQAPI